MEWQHIPACRIVRGPDPRTDKCHADCNRNAYTNKHADCFANTYPNADTNPDCFANTYPNTESHLDAHSHWWNTETTGLPSGDFEIAHEQRIGGKLPIRCPDDTMQSKEPCHFLLCCRNECLFGLPVVDDRPRKCRQGCCCELKALRQ